MRLIPRNTKVKLQFYKGITLPDIFLALTGLALVAITLASNFSFKYLLALGIVCVFAPLFVSIGNERIYMSVVYMFRHLFGRKRYTKNGKDGATIDSITPYEKVENELIKNKDGSYTGVVEIKPIEFRLLAGGKQNYLIDGILANALGIVNLTQEAEIVKLDKELNLNKQLQAELDRIEDLIAAEENGLITHDEYVSRLNVIEDRITLIDTLNSESRVTYSAYYISVHDKSPTALKDTLAYMKQILQSGSIETNILGNDELEEFIRLSYGIQAENGEVVNVKFRLNGTLQDEKKLSHFVVCGYPLKVGNAWGEDLFDIPSTKVVMKLKPIEKSKAIRRIDNAIIELSTRKKGKASKVIDNTTHVETLSALLVRLQNDNETLFDVTFIITAYDENGKADVKKRVRAKLRENGFSANEMFGRQTDVYLTSTVTEYDKVKISRGIQATSVSACFPFVSNAVIDENGLLLGENRLPVFVDFFKRDSEFVNSNIVVIGKSGSGKSYATKTLLTHLASCGTKIYILDPENEYTKLTENLNGKMLDVASAKFGKVNPFHVIVSLGDENEDGSRNSYFAHLQFLEEFYKTSIPGLSPDCLELLNRLTTEVYAKKGIDEDSRFERLKPENYPTFDDLAELTDERVSTEPDEYNRSCYKILSNYLSKFRSGGRYSNLWNGPTSLNADADFVCFNFQKLIANRNGTVANSQMLLILKWLENEVIKNRDYNLKYGANRKIAVVIDEAHLFVDERYPVALDFMFQLAKRIRKYGGMQIVITQSLKDFAGTPETARKSMAIINVSQYSLIFALPPNDMTELCKLYEKAGQINAAERENIVHNPRGSAFLISSPEKRTNIRIVATPYVESLFDENNQQKEI